VYDTENPVPRSEGKLLLRSAKRKFGRRRYHLFRSRLREIRFATFDYTRKLLRGNPIFAQPGEEGYDPDVEKQAKALFKRKDPLSPEVRARMAKERAKPVMATEHGSHRITVGGKPGWAPGQKVKTRAAGRAEITRQQKDLTALPKETPFEELPPSGDYLPRQKSGPTSKRGSGVPGSTPPPYTWDPSKGGPGDIHYTYRNQFPPHLRPALTPEQIRANALQWRDPLSSHETKAKAGLGPNLILTRNTKDISGKARPPTGLASRYLEPGYDAAEREEVQRARDKLAGQIQSVRKETIQPMRAARRKAVGLMPVRPMSEKKIADIRLKGWKRGDKSIVETGKMVPVLMKHNQPNIPIHDLNLTPQGLQDIHHEQRNIISEIQETHKAKAAKIKEGIFQRIHKKLTGAAQTEGKGLFGDAKRHTVTRYEEIEKGARGIVDQSFDPSRTSAAGELARVPGRLKTATPAQMEHHEASQIAEHAGVHPDWIKKQHRDFFHHTRMGETQSGADEIRSALGSKIFSHVTMPEAAAAKRSYPLIAKLGKRTAIGAGIAAGLGLGTYAASKIRKRKQEFRFEAKGMIPYSRAKRLVAEVKARTLRRAAAQGRLKGYGPLPGKDVNPEEISNITKSDKQDEGLMSNLHQNLVRNAEVVQSARYKANKRQLDRARAEGHAAGTAAMESDLDAQRQASMNIIGGLKEDLSKTRHIAVAGGVGGLGVGAGAGYYSGKRNDRRQETRFAIPTPGGRAYRALREKLKHNLGHEIAIGAALTGGITAADAATSAIFPAHGQTRKEAAAEGAKRGAVYGSVLSGVEPLIRIPLSKKLSMSSKLKEIRFRSVKWEDNPLYPEDSKKSVQEVPIKKIVSHQDAVKRHIVEEYKKKPGKALPILHKIGGKYYVEDGNHRIVAKSEKGDKTIRAAVRELQSRIKEIKFQEWATLHFEDPDIPSPWNKKRRLTVAQDRYRKVIREREIERHEANIGKSALTGAALGGVIHHKLGTRLIPSLAVGAGAGLAAQTAAMIHGHGTKDPYGEASISGKRIERLPYQVGGLAAAGLVGHSLYKSARKVKLFSSPSRLIHFQWMPTEDNRVPWHVKETKRWLQHPQSRVEWAQKWGARAGRIKKDIGLPQTKKGKIVDERGRERTPEWKKDWFKRSVYGGAAVAGLVGVGVLGRRIGTSAGEAARLIDKGAKIGELTPWQRMSANIASKNVFRAGKESISSKFPTATKGVRKMGGLRQEFHDVYNDLLRKGNTAIESRAGTITGVTKKIDRKTGKASAYQFVNPAEAKENLVVSQAREGKLTEAVEQEKRRRTKIRKGQIGRSAMDFLTQPPKSGPENLSVLLDDLIQFQDQEPGYVKVKPHYRKERRYKTQDERWDNVRRKQQSREGALFGGLIATGGLGAAGGILYKGHSQKAAEDMEQRVADQLAQIKAARRAAVRSGASKVIHFPK
jgi:hypothetical protein